MIGFSLGLVSGQKGDPTPAPPVDLAINDLARNKMVMDARIGRAGGGQARVALSGTATTGEVVQAYDRGADTWRDVATADGAGIWSGVLLSTNDDGDFQVAKTRLKSSTGTIADTGNTFATGTVVIVYGQSEAEYPFNTFGGSSTPGAVVVSDTDALQLLWVDNDEISSPSATHKYITTDASHTKAVAVLSNTLAAFAPNRKFLFVDGVHEGTGRAELMSDARNDVVTGRRWSTLQLVVDWVRDNGSNIGLVLENWFSSDLAKQPFLDAWAPMYFGQLANGSTFTLGNTHVAAGVNDQVDHCLWDMDAASDARGRGLFAVAETGLAQIWPMALVEVADLSNSVTLAAGGTAGIATQTKAARPHFQDFNGDARTQQISGDLLPYNYCMMGRDDGAGGWTSRAHPNISSPEGSYLLVKHMARDAMIGTGAISVTNPAFVVSATDVNGAYVDLELTGSGTLTTRRAQLGEVRPTGEAYYNDILGFEIEQGGGYAPTGFTATIQDAANRIVRITPDVAFANNDLIRFGYGGGSGWMKSATDGPNEINKDWPLLDKGWTEHPGLFAECWPQTPEFTLSGIVATGPATFTTSATGPRFHATSNIPSSTIGMTFYAKIMAGYMSGNSTYFVDAASTTWRVETLVTGKLRVTIEDSTGLFVLLNGVTTNAVIPLSTDFEIGVAVDLAAQWCKIFIDGAEVHEFALAAGSGVFTNGREVNLLARATGGSTQVVAEIEYLKFWYSATVDGSEPAGAPDALIEGPAATANAHPWKQGSDAS